MNAAPKISVIIPVYNTEPYLRECLDSVVAQSLSDIEIIIINDGSPDNSMGIIREYEKKDNRIVVIDKKNEGVGKARNDGLSRAAGEFVAFMDSDDYYPDADVLAALYNAAKEQNVPIAGGRCCGRQADIEEYGLHFSKRSGTYREYQYDYGYWTYIYDRRMLLNNDIRFPSYGRFQDPPFFVKAMTKGERYAYIDKDVYVYRAVPAPAKYSVAKTLDMMKGLADNLVFSKQNGLSKLHCLTAQRLSHEASFMINTNLQDKRYAELLSAFFKTLSLIDFDWLKSEGCPLPEPFVPEVFAYMRDTAMKYEKLRRNRLLRLIAKLRK